jgi:hypothetical protein
MIIFNFKTVLLVSLFAVAQTSALAQTAAPVVVASPGAAVATTAAVGGVTAGVVVAAAAAVAVVAAANSGGSSGTTGTKSAARFQRAIKRNQSGTFVVPDFFCGRNFLCAFLSG